MLPVLIHVIIMIASFYTALFPMRLKALNTTYYYPCHWIHFNAALTVHIFHSLGSIPCLKLSMTHCNNGAGKFKHNHLSHSTHWGGGGGGFTPDFRWYVPRQSEKWGSPERAWARKWGSPELTLIVGHVWLALWPFANRRALPERFAFGLAAVSWPWVAMNGLKWSPERQKM